MDNDIHARFAALSPAGKARVLARLIHMETIHVRAAHLDDPHDSHRLYGSSEFMHYLSGYILRVLNPNRTDGADEGMVDSVLVSVRPRGQYYIDKLADWINAET